MPVNLLHETSWLCDELAVWRFWRDDRCILKVIRRLTLQLWATVVSGTKFRFLKQLNVRHTSKPAKIKVKWLKLRMSSGEWVDLLCCVTDRLRISLCYCHISKIPLIMQNFLNFVVWQVDYWTVTSWLCDELAVWRVDCAELTVWQVDRVMSWSCDELTGSPMPLVGVSDLSFLQCFKFNTVGWVTVRALSL